MKRKAGSIPTVTIVILTWYKTNVNRFKQMVSSLFDPEMLSQELYNEQYKSDIVHKYWDENYLPKLIQHDSITEPVELLIMMDGCSDNSNKELETTIRNSIKEFVDSFKDYNNLTIRYHAFDENVKTSVSRNTAIKIASSDYIVFCDDDDIRANVNDTIRLVNILKNCPDQYIGLNTLMGTIKKIDTIKKSHQPNISVCPCVWRTEFLRKSNMIFPQKLATEDIIWRACLNTFLSLTGNKILQIEKEVSYIHMPQGGTSTVNTALGDNGFMVRKPKTLDEMYMKSLQDNKLACDYIKTVFETMLKIFPTISLSEWLVFAISSASCLYRGYSVIRRMCGIFQDKLSAWDKQMIYYCNSLFNGKRVSFNKLTNDDKIKCLQLFSMFNSAADTYALSKAINNEDPFTPLNLLWNRTPDELVDKIPDVPQIQNFAFRYICLKQLRQENIDEYVDIFDQEITSKLLVIKKWYVELLNTINISEILMFIKQHSSKYQGQLPVIKVEFTQKHLKVPMDIELEVCSEIKKLDTEHDKYAPDPVTYEFAEKYKIIRDCIKEYVKENNIVTTTLYPVYEDGKKIKDVDDYKGPMTVFLTYFLSPSLLKDSC
jgi:glycosyltransferase involved in cell wall biosynthesis